jgi:hypothetical protein
MHILAVGDFMRRKGGKLNLGAWGSSLQPLRAVSSNLHATKLVETMKNLYQLNYLQRRFQLGTLV